MQKKFPPVEHTLSANSVIIRVKGGYIATDFETQMVLVSGEERVYHPCYWIDGSFVSACPVETYYDKEMDELITEPATSAEGSITFVLFLNDHDQLRIPMQGELITMGRLNLNGDELRYETEVVKYLTDEVVSNERVEFKSLHFDKKTPLSVVDLSRNPILIDT
jgi:hypothetical protein